MIQWCAFCQRFFGFKEPRESFDITHGICTACHDLLRSGAATPEIRERRWFYEKLSKATSDFDTVAIGLLVEEGLKAGITPEDLLIRILQPSLYEIGHLWETGMISVADEHRFTSVSSAIIELLFAGAPQTASYRNVSTPKILLAVADGNQHILGLKMIEFLLTSYRVPTFSCYDDRPPDEIFRLCQHLKPKMIGVSIAHPWQLDWVEKVRQLFVADGQNIEILLGGYFFNQGALDTLCERFTVCAGFAQLWEFVKVRV